MNNNEVVPSTVTTVRIPTRLYEVAKKKDCNFSAIMKTALEAYLKINSSDIEILKKREIELDTQRQKLDAELSLITIEKEKLEAIAKREQETHKQLRDCLRKTIITLLKCVGRDGNVEFSPLKFHASLCKVEPAVLETWVKQFANEWHGDTNHIDAFIETLNFKDEAITVIQDKKPTMED